jgi:hypothetical protein
MSMTKRPLRLPAPIFTLGGALTLALTALSGSALAFENEKPACYSTAPVWNASRGAIVSGVSGGAVAAVLSGVGETRTHTMISHGDWATHSTTRAPSIQTASVYAGICPACVKVGSTPDPNRPLKAVELAQGSPGFTQINMGGAYAYWSSASQVWRQYSVPITAEEIQDPTLCGNICKARGAADWLWFDVPYVVTNASGGWNNFFYSLGYNDGAGAYVHYSYGFKQYMDGLWRARYGFEGETVHDRGIVCSQVPGYAYRHFVDSKQPKIPAGTNFMTVHTYTHAQTVNSGVALWYSVYNSCRGVEPGFWGEIANAISVLYYGDTIQEKTCSNAAWQVLNCFFQGEDPNGGGCKSISSSAWNAYAANGAARGARSVSPDALMGLSGHPTTTAAGPWANWRQNGLQWNGGGSTYGCYW